VLSKLREGTNYKNGSIVSMHSLVYKEYTLYKVKLFPLCPFLTSLLAAMKPGCEFVNSLCSGALDPTQAEDSTDSPACD
jgi:hypothetical protein